MPHSRETNVMQTPFGQPPRMGLLALGLTVAVASHPARAQAQPAPSVSGFIGVTVPTGEFADQVGGEAGLAEQGWVAGVDFSVPMGRRSDILWFSSLEAMTFGVSDAFMSGFSGDGIELDLGSYFGSVLSTGLRYDVEANPFLVIHLGGQIGAGFFKAPDATVSGMGETVELVSFFTPVHGFGASVGATVNDRIRLDAKFFHLRNPEIEGEIRSSGPTEAIDGEQPMAWVRLGIGIKLR